MTQLLAPCPFCGGAARAPKAIGGHSSAFRIVQCSRSDSCGSVAGSTDDEAIAAWNTRTTDAEQAKIAALVEALEKRDRDAVICPIDKPRISDADRAKCSICGALPSESCIRKALADDAFVGTARAILAKGEQP